MIRTFEVIRQEDESGVSGVGLVAEGVIFSDGTCITRWVSHISPGRSTVVWDSYGAFSAVHISSHPNNKTQVIFNDGEEFAGATKVKKPRRRREATANGK
jgi:hypothetical protein